MTEEASRLAHIEAMKTYPEPEGCGCKDCEAARLAAAPWRRFGKSMFSHFRAREILRRFSFALSGDTLVAGRYVKPLPKAGNDR